VGHIPDASNSITRREHTNTRARTRRSDLKSSNVLVTAAFRARLTDFGGVHKKEGLLRHSSLWKAPERLLGGPVTEASEVLPAVTVPGGGEGGRLGDVLGPSELVCVNCVVSSHCAWEESYVISSESESRQAGTARRIIRAAGQPNTAQQCFFHDSVRQGCGSNICAYQGGFSVIPLIRRRVASLVRLIEIECVLRGRC
jgi:hypothetical protein